MVFILFNHFFFIVNHKLMKKIILEIKNIIINLIEKLLIKKEKKKQLTY